jgi:hypothetical protein
MLGRHFVSTHSMMLFVPAKSGDIRPVVQPSREIPRVGDRCEGSRQDGRRRSGGWSLSPNTSIECCVYNELQPVCLRDTALQHTHTDSPPFCLCGLGFNRRIFAACLSSYAMSFKSKEISGGELIFRVYFKNYACHKPDVPQIAKE